MTDRPPALQVEIIDNVEGFDRLREEWQGLHARTVPRNVFSSFVWSRSWWRTFGTGRRPFLVVVRDRERLLALAPLELSRLHQILEQETLPEYKRD